VKPTARSSSKRFLRYVALAAALGLLSLGAGGVLLDQSAQVPAGDSRPESVVPKGDRLLAIDITEAEEGGFDEAFQQALGAGMEVAGLPLQWDELESAPGQFANPLLEIADLFYPLYGIEVALGCTASRLLSASTRSIPTTTAGPPTSPGCRGTIPC